MKRADRRRYCGIEVRSSGGILLAAGMVVWRYRAMEVWWYGAILLSSLRLSEHFHCSKEIFHADTDTGITQRY